MTTRRRTALLASAAGSVAAAAVGGLGARQAPEVYGRIAKPRWAPPAAAFGPVWTVLYVGIAAAGARLGRQRHTQVPAVLHATQLALNAAWSPVFFTARSKRAALGVIVALDATVLAEIAVLAKRDRTAALLLVPYLAWSGFATALTAAVSDPAEV
ncbi:MAG: TspO/MBR family protein [Actinomycetales bacterium]